MSMEVSESRNCLEYINGTLRFKYSMLLLRNDDNEFFSARSSDPHPASTVQLCEQEDAKRIAPLPFYPPGVIVAPATLANMDDTYVKRPDLLRLAAPNDSQASLLEKVRVCEMIKRHPHPSLAEYRGCVLSEGRIIGICFKRYGETLMEKVNPGHLNKSMLIEAPERAAARKEATRYLPNIRAGLQHLHSLGIIHNDLNPMNIMIDENNNPVIIDFDSCRVVGAPLQDVKRTYGWYNQDVGVSRESNDIEALKEIQVFLAGPLPEDLIFSI